MYVKYSSVMPRVHHSENFYSRPIKIVPCLLYSPHKESSATKGRVARSVCGHKAQEGGFFLLYFVNSVRKC